MLGGIVKSCWAPCSVPELYALVIRRWKTKDERRKMKDERWKTKRRRVERRKTSRSGWSPRGFGNGVAGVICGGCMNHNSTCNTSSVWWEGWAAYYNCDRILSWQFLNSLEPAQKTVVSGVTLVCLFECEHHKSGTVWQKSEEKCTSEAWYLGKDVLLDSWTVR